MKPLWSDLVVIGLLISLIDSRASVLQTSDSNGIFSIPTRMMDDADLLEEHGRFMLANMNPTIDPCENFFEYACGNWQNDSMVPLLGRNDTFFNTIEDELNNIIVDFLKNSTVLDEKTAESKAKKFFSSCMNMGGDLSKGYRRFDKSIREPIVKEGDTLDWMVLNFHSEYGLTPLLPLLIQYNDRSLVFELFIKAPAPYLTTSSFNFTKISEDLKFEDIESVEKELEKLRSFEKKLIASVTPTNTSKSQSLKDFLEAQNSSDLDWKRFFDLAFNGTAKDSWIINDNVMNFTNINKFLSTSDTGVMFKYVKWQHIMFMYNNLQLEDTQNLESKCRDITISFFESAIIPWLIETTFDEERRADALLISKHLKGTFYSLIDQTTWLDSKTKSEAKSKLRAMNFVFGYTDDMKHRSKMGEKFKDLNITENFWVNVMNLDKSEARNKLRMIGKAVIELNLYATAVNALYDWAINQVYMTIGMFQLPLYHIKLPNSLKFGGMGSVIGHEMAHAFDSGNYEYDYEGKERNWWSPQSLRNFKERYQCLESQYNKFIYEGVRINGKHTSGDNIADNVGLKIAYQAYLRFLDTNFESAKDKPLPGVDFTNKHLFFLKFAQIRCDGRSVDERLKIMSKDEHSINEYRVIGTLMNMPEFSEEFNCPLGSNMNPLKKCIIYGNE